MPEHPRFAGQRIKRFCQALLVASVGFTLSPYTQAQTHAEYNQLSGKIKKMMRYVIYNPQSVDNLDDTKVLRTVMTFRRDGNLKEKIRYNRNGSIRYKNEFVYNNRGRLVRMVVYGPNGDIKFNVDVTRGKGAQKATLSFTRPDGSLAFKVTHDYDDQGRRKSLKRYRPNNIQPDYIKEIYYSANGKFTKRIKRRIGPGDRVSKLIYLYTYGNHGQLINMRRYHYSGSGRSNNNYYDEYRYTADKYGNWITARHYRIKEILPGEVLSEFRSISIREIEYYH